MAGAATTQIAVADPSRTTRAPSDVLRLVVGGIALVVVLLLEAFAGDTVVDAVADLLRGLDQLPSWMVTLVVGAAQGAGAVLVVLVIVAAVQRRTPRVLITAVAAGLVAAIVAGLLDSADDTEAQALSGQDSVLGLGSDESWSMPSLAALTAVVATIGPWLPRWMRRVGWIVVMCVALVHSITTPTSWNTLIALLVGWVVGTAVTVVSGSPSHRPTGASIVAGLAAVGQPLATLEQATLDARGSTPYFGTTPGGTKLFVKALGKDERSADLLFRAYRRVQPHDLADEKAFSTLRRAVEHEALVALAARDVGIRTPRMLAVARAEPAGLVLAYEAIAGRSLDRLEPEEMTDELIDQVWRLLAQLRQHGIAHRDLRLANVFMADDGEAWIIDFGFSELAASGTLLASDVAELIASTAAVVGPERSVSAAVGALGADGARTALPRLELPMLSGATRTAMKADRACLPEIRRRLESAES
jgi:glycosyltransferase 2 family protein